MVQGNTASDIFALLGGVIPLLIMFALGAVIYSVSKTDQKIRGFEESLEVLLQRMQVTENRIIQNITPRVSKNETRILSHQTGSHVNFADLRDLERHICIAYAPILPDNFWEHDDDFDPHALDPDQSVYAE